MLPSSEGLLPWVAAETTHANFHSRFLIKLPICRKGGAGRWGESPFTHPGIASDPWRTDVNVAHTNTKRLCGSILHGDVGALLRSQPNLSATFCLLLERQYHAAASIAGMDQCAAVASPFLYLISSPLYLSLTITPALRCQCIFLRTITWVLGFFPVHFHDP